MKYIRTKDGIYRVLQWGAKRKHYVICCNGSSQGKFDFDTKEVIKQADTIEELCDEFVIIDDLDRGINTLWRTKVFSLQEVRKMVKYNEVYGAIWTDKGLIYVTKMNDKGDLELL